MSSAVVVLGLSFLLSVAAVLSAYIEVLRARSRWLALSQAQERWMTQQLPWPMPDDEIPSFLRLLEQSMARSDITVRHRDALIRLRAILEADHEKLFGSEV
jgi:hypothetical protein